MNNLFDPKRSPFTGLGLFKPYKPVKAAAPKIKEKKDLAAKVILVYSGKGGVGKTTTTANIARVLSERGKKVMVIDMDVNTPSMAVVFPTSIPNDNLLIESIGYERGSNIYLEDNLVRRYIKGAIKKAVEYKPEYILIDTPPSITDVHINLINEIKISGMILVTQPNELSRTDVFKTVTFFELRSINIIGIVENMTINKNTSEYQYKVLGKVPFVKTFSFNDVYAKYKPVYTKIAETFDTLSIVMLEEKRKQILDEGVEIDDNIIKQFEDAAKKRTLKFININTWDTIRDILDESQIVPMMQRDKFLDVTTTDRIKRMIEAFEEDDEALFMITNAPNTEVYLFPGEIGKAKLVLGKESYYGVPRIEYQTKHGDVILFPHEVMPATNKIINDAMQDGAKISSDGRYIPSINTLQQLDNSFGERVGLLSNWESKYHELYS